MSKIIYMDTNSMGNFLQKKGIITIFSKIVMDPYAKVIDLNEFLSFILLKFFFFFLHNSVLRSLLAS